MDALRVAYELAREFPGARILNVSDNNPPELICELDSAPDHPEFNRTIAVIDRVPGNFNKKSTLSWRVLKGTLLLFPYGQKVTRPGSSSPPARRGQSAIEEWSAPKNRSTSRRTIHPGARCSRAKRL
jgi:hypothetical protein